MSRDNKNKLSLDIETRSAEGKALRAIWELRKGKMTQGKFAGEVLHLSNSVLTQLFNGRVVLKLATAKIFADYLHCSIRDFSPRLAAEDERDKTHVRWPFPNLDFATVDKLSAPSIARLEGVIRAWIMENEALPDASKRTADKESAASPLVKQKRKR